MRTKGISKTRNLMIYGLLLENSRLNKTAKFSLETTNIIRFIAVTKTRFSIVKKGVKIESNTENIMRKFFINLLRKIRFNYRILRIFQNYT